MSALLLLALLGTSHVQADAGIDPSRIEPGVLPALTYDSELGLGVGALVNLVQFTPDRAPYAWRLEALTSVTLRPGGDGGVEAPFQQHYVTLEVPGLADGRLRLDARLSFDREANSPWFGLGNASVRDAARLSENRHAWDADRLFPALRGALRARLVQHDAGRLEVFGGVGALASWTNVYPGSQLERDLATVGGVKPHGLGTLVAGLLFDGRDHESAPTRGVFAELSLRAGASVADERFAYGGLTFDQRAFVPLGSRFVVAGHLLVDLLVGEAPYYELSRSGGLNPLSMGGGGRSLRGLPNGRYAAKIKLVANLEVRGHVFAFELFKQRFKLGAVAFGDAGRFFADWKTDSVLDGVEAGVKLGVGGGLRLQWGEHFVVRFDGAWSPTDQTSGFYVGIRHLF